MPTPFDPQPLTPVQQKQIADREAATEAIELVDQHIVDVKTQLQELSDAWYMFSQPLPAQSPLDPKIPARENVAAMWYKAFDLLNKLLSYRDALVGWKIGVGQPNHPEMPQFQG